MRSRRLSCAPPAHRPVCDRTLQARHTVARRIRRVARPRRLKAGDGCVLTDGCGRRTNEKLPRSRWHQSEAELRGDGNVEEQRSCRIYRFARFFTI